MKAYEDMTRIERIRARMWRAESFEYQGPIALITFGWLILGLIVLAVWLAA